MKWEYLTVPIFGGTYSDRFPYNAPNAKPISELGLDGWELVIIIAYRGEDNLGYFKREFREQRSKD